MQYDAVKYGALRYDVAQCGTMRYSCSEFAASDSQKMASWSATGQRFALGQAAYSQWITIEWRLGLTTTRLRKNTESCGTARHNAVRCGITVQILASSENAASQSATEQSFSLRQACCLLEISIKWPLELTTTGLRCPKQQN